MFRPAPSDRADRAEPPAPVLPSLWRLARRFTPLRRRLVRLVARGIAFAFVATALSAGGLAAGASTGNPPPTRAVISRTGTLPDGAAWITHVPAEWNGTLMLYQHGLVPPGEDNPATDSSDPLSARYLLDHGFALAGSSFATTGWAVEDGLADQRALLHVFQRSFGRPRHTVTWGDSIGGMMAAALAEQEPRIDGALSICGPNAGAVGLWNSYLDVLFTLRTLLAPGASIELTNITDPFASFGLLQQALASAQKTPEGRARIALAAAVGNLPGWVDADQPEPGREDVATQEQNQFETLTNVTVVLGILERAEFEARAGGNAGFNTGVDYSKLLRRSTDRREVEQLYERAGAHLSGDLKALAAAPRIAAEPKALAYLKRFVTFNGDLGGTPVLTLHTVADPLAPVEHEQAYAAAVHRAGNARLLRQVFADRAGHCAFTPAEKMAALRVLLQRIETGTWKHATRPRALNARAEALGPDLNVALGDDGKVFPVAPKFTRFHPGRFPRPFDRSGRKHD